MLRIQNNFYNPNSVFAALFKYVNFIYDTPIWAVFSFVNFCLYLFIAVVCQTSVFGAFAWFLNTLIGIMTWRCNVWFNIYYNKSHQYYLVTN